VNHRSGTRRFQLGFDIGFGVTVTLGAMLLIGGLFITMNPPNVIAWLPGPASVLAGYLVIVKRRPADAYPIGVLFIPIMLALVWWLAFLYSWHVLGEFT
jgi:hypothetical protein